jgi:hypothetical protein
MKGKCYSNMLNIYGLRAILERTFFLKRGRKLCPNLLIKEKFYKHGMQCTGHVITTITLAASIHPTFSRPLAPTSTPLS